jgi:hypothetical protein
LFTASRALPFVADAVSYFASIAGVMAIRRPLGPELSDHEQREPLWRAVAGGLRFLLSNGYLRFVAWWAAVMNMLAGGLMLLVILIVRGHGGSPTEIGTTQAIGSVGGILGAVISSWVIRRLAGRWLVIGLSWLIAGAAFGMAVVPAPWGIGALLAVVTVVAVPLNVVFDTYEMQIIPDALTGRVSTAVDLAANGLRWLAPLSVGVVVEATSTRTCAIIWGAALALVAVLVMVNRSLHVLDQPVEQVAAAEINDRQAREDRA